MLGTSRGPQEPATTVDFLASARRQHPACASAATAPNAAPTPSPQEVARRGAADRRRRHPQDDRQRRQVLLHHLRLLHRRGRGRAGDRPRPRRSQGGDQRRRPGEAHGPRGRVHHRLRDDRQRRSELLLHPRDPAGARRPARLPAEAQAAADGPRARRGRRRRRRGAAPARTRSAEPTPPATASLADIGVFLKERDRTLPQGREDADERQVLRPQLSTFAACRPRRSIRCCANASPAPPSTPRWRARPTCSSACGTVTWSTCRWRSRPAS